MNAPLSWLKEYVKINSSAEKLAEKLLIAGNKVEEVKKIGKETVFNFEITSNRPDTLSIYGLAREIAALTNQDLLPLETELLIPPGELKTSPNMKITEKKLCPYYTFGIVGGVSVGPTPTWIVERLSQVGMRSVNNVVDITNYVMHETGQPMHAFDYDKVKGELVLRASKEAEVVRTLDGVDRRLEAGSIIIEDSEKLIDLAGIMGGENSEIDENTKRIFLHVPIYDPVAIRRTSQKLGFRTEASNRFEKKLDPAGHLVAFERAVKLLTELAGGHLATEPKSIKPEKESSLSLEIEMIEKVLGVKIQLNEIINILSSLGFRVTKDPFKEEELKIVIPTWRTDIEEAIDLVEEVGRIYGYNRFPRTIPSGELPNQPDSFGEDWEAFFRHSFKMAGFDETMTYTLLSKDLLTKAGFDFSHLAKVSNPMSEDFEYLRPSLLPELLAALAKNKLNREISFFEIGRIFEKEEKTTLPNQPVVLEFVTTEKLSLAKGLVQTILEKTDFQVTEEIGNDPLLQETIFFKSGKNLIAKLGLVREDILTNLDISSGVVSGTIFVESFSAQKLNYHYQPLPKFPPVIEDLSMFIPDKVSLGKIIGMIKKTPLVASVEVFDVFLDQTRRSIAIRLVFQAKDRTLTDIEVGKIREKLGRSLEKTFGVQIRKA